MKARYTKRILKFKVPAGTSRGQLTSKTSYFIILKKGKYTGIGECSIVPNLSIDDRPDFEEKLQETIQAVNKGNTLPSLSGFPAIRTGIEMAHSSYLDKKLLGVKGHAYTKAYKPVPINGLVWMGNYQYMKGQIDYLISQKYKCIKIKIGSIDFESELALVKYIREKYSKRIKIRLDANGAFSYEEALDKIAQLSEFSIHSIEQPIKTRKPDDMRKLRRKSSIPIALDEDITIASKLSYEEKSLFLFFVKPRYIVLKPSLIGGFSQVNEWIEIADSLKVRWWMTSALESNVGLNALANWLAQFNIKLEQGLGTGSLFTNNIQVPIRTNNGFIEMDPKGEWQKLKTI